MNKSRIEEIGYASIGCAIEVHRVLGPGMLESVYEECLMYELHRAGLRAKRQQRFNIQYKDIVLSKAYRADIVVEDLILLEVKSAEAVHDLHRAQLLTYLKCGGYHLGYILNFHVKLMQHGIVRLVYNYDKPLEENTSRF